MPKLLQPWSLKKMAFYRLQYDVHDFLYQLRHSNDFNKLHETISTIKKYLYDHLPQRLLADFLNTFFDEYRYMRLLENYGTFVLDFIMDVEIVGLRCTGPILAYLNTDDRHRLRWIEELNLNGLQPESSCTFPRDLENFQLQNLTTLIFPENCTDHDLQTIGRNCSKIEVIKIRHSSVTDRGLFFLRFCSELCVVDIFGCSDVTLLGINGLLNLGKKLKDVTYGYVTVDRCQFWTNDDRGLSKLDSSVQCPSMSRIIVEVSTMQNSDLDTIVTKFPNLTYLGLHVVDVYDLSALKSLNNLTGLEFKHSKLPSLGRPQSTQLWVNFKKLLTCVGANITSLKFCDHGHRFPFHQDNLNFIFTCCPKLEYLKFRHQCHNLVIPPHQTLKELTVIFDFEFDHRREHPPLIFNQLLNLETLTLGNHLIRLQDVESMMLDDIKFPNLSVINQSHLKPHEFSPQLALDKNLDFKIQYIYDSYFDESDTESYE